MLLSEQLLEVCFHKADNDCTCCIRYTKILLNWTKCNFPIARLIRFSILFLLLSYYRCDVVKKNNNNRTMFGTGIDQDIMIQGVVQKMVKS